MTLLRLRSTKLVKGSKAPLGRTRELVAEYRVTIIIKIPDAIKRESMIVIGVDESLAYSGFAVLISIAVDFFEI